MTTLSMLLHSGEEDLNYLNTLQIQNKDSKDFIIHDDWKNKSRLYWH